MNTRNNFLYSSTIFLIVRGCLWRFKYTFRSDVYCVIMKPDRYETISIESKIREGVFHKVVKDLESGKAVSCSCKCWSKGNKPCVGMRTVGYES